MRRTRTLALLCLLQGACAESCPLPFDPINMADPGSDAFAAYMEAHLDAMRVPGAGVALVQDGEILWSGGFGLADARHKLPVETDTSFMLASLSKPTTGATLMRAVEEGLLDLDAPIDQFLPFSVENPNHPGVPITARQLLQHRSSIHDVSSVIWGNYVHGDSEQELGDFLADFLVPGGKDYKASRNFLESAPGDTREYCNIGFALAGFAVESAVGQPFDAYSDAEILAPLGLEGTAWMLADLDDSKVAHPHARRLFGGWHTMKHYGYPDYPDGQLRAPASEVAKLLLALHPETPEAEAALEASSRWEMASQSLGLERGNIIGGTAIGHGGSDKGVNTEAWLYEDERTGYVLLLNARIKTDRQRENRACVEDALVQLVGR